MKSKTLPGILFILLLFVFTMTSLGATKEETIEETLKIDSGKPVDLEFRENDGNVRFSTWDRDEVHILVHKEVKTLNGRRTERLFKDTKVEISQHNNSIRIRIRYPRIQGFFFISDVYRVRVNSEIKIPKNSNLTCHADDGDISIESVDGEMYLKADDGTIRVVNSSGSVEGGTDDGRFNLDDFTGKAKIDSDDGDLFISGNLSYLDLETDDGDIRIKNFGAVDMEKDWQIHTDDGDVDIYFPEEFSAEFHIRTDDGSIDNFLPIVFKEITSKRNITGIFNQGGHLITIKTDDGDITLRETKF